MVTVLDMIEPQIAPFDPPTMKTLPRTKYKVDQTTRSRFLTARILAE